MATRAALAKVQSDRTTPGQIYAPPDAPPGNYRIQTDGRTQEPPLDDLTSPGVSMPVADTWYGPAGGVGAPIAAGAGSYWLAIGTVSIQAPGGTTVTARIVARYLDTEVWTELCAASHGPLPAGDPQVVTLPLLGVLPIISVGAECKYEAACNGGGATLLQILPYNPGAPLPRTNTLFLSDSCSIFQIVCMNPVVPA